MERTAELAELAQALITSRYSVSPKRLEVPGPSAAQLQALVEAAACAPDHAGLRPWRLIRIGSAARGALAELFAAALLERDAAAAPEDQARARDKAHRAPELLLAVLRREPPHPDVPVRERYVALGAALMNLLLAAHGQGYAGMLTSGKALDSPAFAQAFGLEAGEEPVCFVSLGTPAGVRRQARASADELLSEWTPAAQKVPG